MTTTNDQLQEDKKLLILRSKDLEFVDDVSEFKCKRCEKVLIQHYISNCDHAFCANCKRLLGDGSGRWPCPHCHQFIKKIDFQDFEFERKLFDQRVRCTNTKYGCSFICLLKELGEHLRSCEFTRENALPVVYQETNTIEAVLEQLSLVNRRIEAMEEKITKIEINQETFGNKLKTLDNRIETVNSVLPEQISKINMEIENSKKNQLSDKWISTLDKMKYKIANLNKKSDLWLEVLEMKEEKINKLINQQKIDFEKDLKNVSSTLQDETKTNSEKINEATANFALQLKNTESKIEVNKNDLKALKLKTDSCLEKNNELNRITQTLQERNIHVKNSLLDKENRIKNINKKLEILEVINGKSDKLNEDFELIKEEIVKMKIEHEKFDGALKATFNRIEYVSTEMHENTTKFDNLIQAKYSILNEKTDLLSQNLNLKNEKMDKIKHQLRQQIKNNLRGITAKLENLFQSEWLILNGKSDALSDELSLTNEKIHIIKGQLKQEFINDFKKMNSSFTARITTLKTVCESSAKHLKTVEIKVEKDLYELMALKSIICAPENESINKIYASTESNKCLSVQIKVVTECIEYQANQLKCVIESNKNQSEQLKSLDSKIKEINQLIKPLMLKDMYWKRPADFVWQIPRASELLKENVIHKEMMSAPFQLNDYPGTFRAKLSFTADSFCVRLSSGSAMQCQPQPSIYLIIKNQFYESRAWDVMKLASIEFQSSPQICDYKFETIAKSQLKGLFSYYVNNDKLLLEFHVEPPWMTSHACSYDGNLSWAIDNYKKRKELETSGYVAFHESPYFYTKLKGYRVRIRFWLNLIRNQDGVYAGVDFLTGEYDDYLKGEIIPHKITITILNPKNPVGHIIKSEIYDPPSKQEKAQCFYVCSKDETESVVAGDMFYYHAKIEEI